MDFATSIDDDIVARIAAGEEISLAFERVDEGGAVGGARPARADVRPALGLRDAGAFLLLLLPEIFLRCSVCYIGPAGCPLCCLVSCRPVIRARGRARIPARLCAA